MNWTWATEPDLEDPALGAEIADGWPTRAAAEAWLSDWHTELADAGVGTVTLFDGETAVYSMGLCDA